MQRCESPQIQAATYKFDAHESERAIRSDHSYILDGKFLDSNHHDNPRDHHHLTVHFMPSAIMQPWGNLSSADECLSAVYFRVTRWSVEVAFVCAPGRQFVLCRGESRIPLGFKIPRLLGAAKIFMSNTRVKEPGEKDSVERSNCRGPFRPSRIDSGRCTTYELRGQDRTNFSRLVPDIAMII